MVSKVGVIGAGVMGHGIAEVCAISGYYVILTDVNEDILKKALERIRWSLDSINKKGELKEEPDVILSRIKVTTDLDMLSEVEYLIEAVKEKTEVKRQVLKKVDSIARKEAVFFTNTSTIPISELAIMTKRPEKFIGLHFSNPPVLMPLIEIVMGDRTNAQTLKQTQEFVQSLSKDYVVVKKDLPGFLINRLNDRIILESMIMLENGVPKEVLDAMVRFRLNFPMGVCELLDFVGIDTVYNANKEMMKRGFNTRSSDILGKKVEANTLGMKTGEGFYKYPKPNVYVRPTIIPSEEMYALNPLRIVSTAINEAAWLVRNDVASVEDVEKAMMSAMNWPIGPLSMADGYGLDTVVDMLRNMRSASNESRYEPDPLLTDKVKKGELGRKTGKGFHSWNHEEINFGTVIYTKMHDFALIAINRPEKLNALNEETWNGLRMALEHAQGDDEVRSAIVTGKGRAFSSGDDIEMMDSWKSSMDAKVWMNRFSQPLIDLILSYPKPVISVVNGISFGGGCELNLLFDIVIASEEAIFSVPEGLIGAMPPIASTYGIALISRKLARYALTGDWISPKEALRMGLVDVIIPHEQTDVIMPEIAEKIAKLAPLSVSAIKSSINLVRQAFASQAKYAANELTLLASSRDFSEGQEAFLQKRRPIWENR